MYVVPFHRVPYLTGQMQWHRCLVFHLADGTTPDVEAVDKVIPGEEGLLRLPE